MTPNAIVAAVVTRLKTSTYLSYIDDNNIFEGARDDRQNFPSITIESAGGQVVEYNFPYEVKILKLIVNCAVNSYDKDHQLTDNGKLKGLLTVKNDILKALSQDDNLGLSDVYWVYMPSEQDANINYPIRESNINVEIKYRMDRKLRS